MKMWMWLYGKDAFTLGSAACGLLAIFAAFTTGTFFASFGFIVLAAAFDIADGKIARRREKYGRGSNLFGRELDTLGDIINFGVAPAIIVLADAQAISYWNLFSLEIASAIFFVLSGMIRLSAFNIQENRDCYYGLPINAACFIALGLYLLNKDFLAFYFVALGVLMTLRFKIDKARLRKIPFIGVLFT